MPVSYEPMALNLSLKRTETHQTILSRVRKDDRITQMANSGQISDWNLKQPTRSSNYDISASPAMIISSRQRKERVKHIAEVDKMCSVCRVVPVQFKHFGAYACNRCRAFFREFLFLPETCPALLSSIPSSVQSPSWCANWQPCSTTSHFPMPVFSRFYLLIYSKLSYLAASHNNG
jgi:ribosomal protein L37AE/L43A